MPSNSGSRVSCADHTTERDRTLATFKKHLEKSGTEDYLPAA
jgi:hypothetical protein